MPHAEVRMMNYSELELGEGADKWDTLQLLN